MKEVEILCNQPPPDICIDPPCFPPVLPVDPFTAVVALLAIVAVSEAGRATVRGASIGS